MFPCVSVRLFLGLSVLLFVCVFLCSLVCLFVCLFGPAPLLERSLTESGSFSFAYAVVSTALECAVSHVLSHPQFAIQLGTLKTVPFSWVH